jgi:hypothetical protein
MLKPTDAISIVVRNSEAARWLEAEAQALDWPLEQLRRGHSLPPSVLIGVLGAHQRSCRATAGALLLSATLIAEARRPVEAPLPWWRRLYNRWKSSR